MGLSIRDKIIRTIDGVEHRYAVEAITESFQNLAAKDISFLLKSRHFSSEVQLIKVSFEDDGYGGSVRVETPHPGVRTVIYGAKRSDMAFAPEGANLNAYFVVFYPCANGFERALVRQEAPLVS